MKGTLPVTDSPDAANLIPTGIITLDEAIRGGLAPRGLVVVYGEAGSGKTGLLRTIATNTDRNPFCPEVRGWGPDAEEVDAEFTPGVRPAAKLVAIDSPGGDPLAWEGQLREREHWGCLVLAVPDAVFNRDRGALTQRAEYLFRMRSVPAGGCTLTIEKARLVADGLRLPHRLHLHLGADQKLHGDE